MLQYTVQLDACIAFQAADTISSLDLTQPDDSQYRHVCGRRSLGHEEVHSIRTESAQPGDWPWHVAVLIAEPFTNLADYQCGGNVISRTAILTGMRDFLYYAIASFFDGCSSAVIGTGRLTYYTTCQCINTSA